MIVIFINYEGSIILRSPDVSDFLQIVLEATGSQEGGFLIVHSTISPVLGRDDSLRHAACVFFEVSLTATSWSQKSVSPSPPWFSHDASVLIPRPPS